MILYDLKFGVFSPSVFIRIMETVRPRVLGKYFVPVF
jgi:hypothetical protein